MDFLERSVFSYLRSLDIGEVLYEPLGPNSFPDFSVGGSLAVEATRLTKPLATGGDAALETVCPSVMASLKNAIESVRQAPFERSRFVSLRVVFPLDGREAARARKNF